MPNQYETVFVVTPVLTEEQMMQTVEKFREVLKANGAEIVHEESLGLRKLAYPIQKKSTGFYQMFEFRAEPTLIDKLEIDYRRDERLLRFLTIRLDKYAVAYAESRRNKHVRMAKEAIEAADKAAIDLAEAQKAEAIAAQQAAEAETADKAAKLIAQQAKEAEEAVKTAKLAAQQASEQQEAAAQTTTQTPVEPQTASTQTQPLDTDDAKTDNV